MDQNKSDQTQDSTGYEKSHFFSVEKSSLSCQLWQVTLRIYKLFKSLWNMMQIQILAQINLSSYWECPDCTLP